MEYIHILSNVVAYDLNFLKVHPRRQYLETSLDDLTDTHVVTSPARGKNWGKNRTPPNHRKIALCEPVSLLRRVYTN